MFLSAAVAPLTQDIITGEYNPLISNGNTLYVRGEGPGNYSNIKDAIDNAMDGDMVFVYNGTYKQNENI